MDVKALAELKAAHAAAGTTPTVRAGRVEGDRCLCFVRPNDAAFYIVAHESLPELLETLAKLDAECIEKDRVIEIARQELRKMQAEVSRLRAARSA